MGTQSSAGTTFSISATTPATFDGAGYAAINNFVVVGEITNFGEFGRAYQLIKSNPVASRGTRKKKGSYDEGNMSLQLDLDNDDTGQVQMKAARDSDADYSFCVELQDGSKYFFQALVMDFKTGVNGADNMVTASANVEITTSSAGVGIVEVV